MYVRETDVLYIDENDIIDSCKYLNIEQIEWVHAKNTNILKMYSIVILKIKGKYKVLKSRY